MPIGGPQAWCRHIVTVQSFFFLNQGGDYLTINQSTWSDYFLMMILLIYTFNVNVYMPIYGIYIMKLEGICPGHCACH